MNKLSTFQLVFLGACGLVVLMGVALFAVYRAAPHGGGAVIVWGTFDSSTMQNVLQQLRQADSSLTGVTYVQKSAATYENDTVNAIASGKSPDIILLSQDQVVSFADKLAVIPYGTVSQSAFKSAFIDEGNLFLTLQGEIALPLVVDPLVMYWNRDLYSSAGIAQAPGNWSDFLTDAPLITARDQAGTITRSAVALGGWENIDHPKDILSALFMQAGDPVVLRQADGTLAAAFGSAPQNAAENPAESALRYYTQFADPSKTVYSWNRSLAHSQDAFAAGDLATYFGFASEYPALLARNPNLHIGVAMLPQAGGSSVRLTAGNLVGIAIPKSAPNASGALAAAQKLASQASVVAISAALGLPPARRDLLAQNPSDAAASVFAQSALMARNWPDPSPSVTDGIFKQMVESVLSGEGMPSQAVSDASQSFRDLINTLNTPS